jgi:hypothetical protein
MSMTKLAPVGVSPAHIIDVGGRQVNAEVSAKELDELQWYAETEKFDLEAECLARYGYGSGWLTLAQFAEMIRAIVGRRADRFNSTPSHFHYCSGCGVGRLYFDRHCGDRHPEGNVEDECRACEEALYLKTRRPAL